MAKGFAFPGKIQGKIGGAVFRIDRGKQIISEYNPAPHDAKDASQIAQRARIACASKVSALFPPATVAGMVSKKASARSNFNSELISLVQLTTVGDQMAAIINPEEILLCNNNTAYLNFTGLRLSSTLSSLTIQSNIVLPPSGNVARIMYTVLPRLIVNGEYEMAQMIMSPSFYGESGAKFVSLEMGAAFVTPNREFNVYAVPLTIDSEKVYAKYSDVLLADSNSQMIVQVAIQLAKDGIFKRSVYCGRVYNNPD